jgi:DNA-binding transcriptional MerR regulator
MDSDLVSIGDFSRMTYLTVKALRHYQDVGILEPARVDPFSGYRSYHLSQLPIAHVIRRLRTLEMPLEQIRAVVQAPDVESRNRAISQHLSRMEEQLRQTSEAVSSLRSLLEQARTARDVSLEALPAQWVLAVRGTVAIGEASAWGREAFAELYAALDSYGATRAGVDGGLFYDDFFHDHAGELVAFVPVDTEVAIPAGSTGRVFALELPAVDVAVMTHEGPGDTIDETYAELGAYVTKQAIGLTGPIREYFEAPQRTVVAWPIFRTA